MFSVTIRVTVRVTVRVRIESFCNSRHLWLVLIHPTVIFVVCKLIVPRQMRGFNPGKVWAMFGTVAPVAAGCFLLLTPVKADRVPRKDISDGRLPLSSLTLLS